MNHKTRVMTSGIENQMSEWKCALGQEKKPNSFTASTKLIVPLHADNITGTRTEVHGFVQERHLEEFNLSHDRHECRRTQCTQETKGSVNEFDMQLHIVVKTPVVPGDQQKRPIQGAVTQGHSAQKKIEKDLHPCPVRARLKV